MRARDSYARYERPAHWMVEVASGVDGQSRVATGVMTGPSVVIGSSTLLCSGGITVPMLWKCVLCRTQVVEERNGWSAFVHTWLCVHALICVP